MNQESPVFRIADGQATDASGQIVPTYQHVSFRYEAAENPSASAREGRKVFDKLLIARNYYPGSKDTLDRAIKRWPAGGDDYEILEPVLWERFRAQAEAFEANTAQGMAGMPLAVLNLDVSSEAELRVVGITTVEALAAVPDGSLRGFGNARELRAKAQRLLTAQADAAPLLAAEAAAKEAEQREAEMKADIAALRAELAALRADAPRRGRPPKED